MPRGPASVLSALHLAEPVAPAGLTDRDWRQALDFAYRAMLALEFRRTARDTAPAWVRDELDGAAARNRLRFERLRGLYSETRRRLDSAGIPYLALKGITHCPLYGSDPEARPQYDLDVYVPPARALEARDLFLAAGYEPIEGMETFPTDHLPALVLKTGFEWRGDFFDPELPHAVEIHVQFWNAELEGLPAPGVDQFWERRETRTVAGLEIPAMAPADALAYAALHMLKHVLQGSLRPFHGYEVARMLDARSEDNRFGELHSPELRRLQAVAFRLAESWFGCRMAPAAREEAARLPEAAEVWFREFALSPVARAFHPNKDELWLHLSLVPHRRDALRVARRRLFPLRMPGPVGAVYIPAGQMTPGRRVLKALRRARFAAGRVRYHAVVLPRVLWTGARWWWRSNALGPQFWIFLSAAVLFNFALFVFVLLYNLYLLDLGYREDFVGRLSGTATAGTVAGTLPAAWVLRRLGLRRSLLGVVAALCGVMAMRATARAPAPLLALAFLWGLIFAVWAVMIAPMIASVVDAGRRPAAFSVFFAAMFTVGVVGNWTGGYLPHVLGGKQPALVAAAAMLAAALPAAWRLRPGKAAQDQGRVYPRSPFLARYLAAYALWHLGTGAFNPFANVYFQRLKFPVERIGNLFSGTQMLQVATVLMAPAFIRRAGLVRAIVWMMAATALGLGGLAAQPSHPAAMAAFGWYMSFQWMSEPGLNSLLMNNVAAREQSGASSLNYLVAFAAQAAAAFAAGPLMTHLGYGPVLGGAAALALTAAVLFRVLLG